MKNFLEILKKKWGVSGLDFFLICLVFSLTGITVVLIKPLIFDLLLPDKTSNLIKWFTYIIIIFPTYQLLLLLYAYIFKQFDFFWAKQKKLLLVLSRPFKKNN